MGSFAWVGGVGENSSTGVIKESDTEGVGQYGWNLVNGEASVKAGEYLVYLFSYLGHFSGETQEFLSDGVRSTRPDGRMVKVRIEKEQFLGRTISRLEIQATR